MNAALLTLIFTIIVKLIENTDLIEDVIKLFESKGHDVTTLRANLEAALAEQKKKIGDL
jgi:hypothetical protein